MPEDIVQKVSELGLMGLLVDEELGGMGLPMMAYSRIFENLATHDASLTVTVGLTRVSDIRGYCSSEARRKRKISSSTCNWRAYRGLLSHRAKQWFRCSVD